MYSYEDRIKAIKLYIKYDLCTADTIRELGYPSRNMLVQWYKEYQETGGLHKQYIKHPAYTSEQMKAAVDYYLEHGRNITRTVRILGYPSQDKLAEWIDELALGKRKARIKRGTMLQFSQEQKKDAVIELCDREGSAVAVANRIGASRGVLYKWKKELLGEEDARNMDDGFSKPSLPDDREALLVEVELLKKEIYRKQLELDILKKAAKIIKKDQNQLDKYASLRTEVKETFYENRSRYGYRRVHALIKNRHDSLRKGYTKNHERGTACCTIQEKTKLLFIYRRDKSCS